MPFKFRARRVKANPGSPGAPTAYTPKTVELLCAAYSTGVSLKDAARAAGIGETTVRDWLRESDAEPDGPKGGFRGMLEEAFSKAVVESAHQKRKADPGWWLSRMRPQRFGDPAKRVELEVESKVSLGVVVLPPEDP